MEHVGLDCFEGVRQGVHDAELHAHEATVMCDGTFFVACSCRGRHCVTVCRVRRACHGGVVHGVRCVKAHIPRRPPPTLRRRLLPAGRPAGQQAAGATLEHLGGQRGDAGQEAGRRRRRPRC